MFCFVFEYIMFTIKNNHRIFFLKVCCFFKIRKNIKNEQFHSPNDQEQLIFTKKYVFFVNKQKFCEKVSYDFCQCMNAPIFQSYFIQNINRGLCESHLKHLQEKMYDLFCKCCIFHQNSKNSQIDQKFSFRFFPEFWRQKTLYKYFSHDFFPVYSRVYIIFVLFFAA